MLKLTPEINSSGNIISVNIQSAVLDMVHPTFVRVDSAGKDLNQDLFTEMDNK